MFDDIIVKSHSRSNHLDDLRIVFDIMRAHQLKKNPSKSFLGVSSGKFLRFIVTSEGFHLDPDTVKAIQGMRPPKTLKKLRGLQDRLIYIQSFKLLPTIYTINEERRLLHMGWSLSKGFRGYKRLPHQASGPSSFHFGETIFAPCASYGPLLRHSSVSDEWRKLRIDHLLSKHNSDQSWILIQPRREGMSRLHLRCLEYTTLFGWSNHKCCFKSQSLRILMMKLGSLNCRLANWAILLSQYDMTFVLQKTIKGQALVDFLAAHPALETLKLHTDILDEVIEANITSKYDVWQTFFDDASRIGPTGKIITGVGVVLPENHVLLRAFLLTESYYKA